MAATRGKHQTAAFARLAELYPQARFPPVAIVVGITDPARSG